MSLAANVKPASGPLAAPARYASVSPQKALKRSSSLCRVVGITSLHACRVIRESSGLYCLRDGLHAARVLQGREIARFFAKIRGPDHPAHDLGATGFGQLVDKEHPVRADGPAHGLHDTVDEFTAEGVVCHKSRLED